MCVKFMNNHQQSYTQFQTVSSNNATSSGINAKSVELTGGGGYSYGNNSDDDNNNQEQQ